MKTNAKKIALIASATAAVGSFMPWAIVQTIFGTINVDGMSGDGQLTIALAFVVGLCTYFGKRKAFLVAIFASILGMLISIADIVNVTNKFGKDDPFRVTVGYGLYLCAIAFVTSMIALIGLYKFVTSTPIVLPPPVVQEHYTVN